MTFEKVYQVQYAEGSEKWNKKEQITLLNIKLENWTAVDTNNVASGGSKAYHTALFNTEVKNELSFYDKNSKKF